MSEVNELNQCRVYFLAAAYCLEGNAEFDVVMEIIENALGIKNNPNEINECEKEFCRLVEKFTNSNGVFPNLEEMLEKARRIPKEFRFSIIDKCRGYFVAANNKNDLTETFLKLLQSDLEQPSGSLKVNGELIAVLSKRLSPKQDIIYLLIQLMIIDGKFEEEEISFISSFIDTSKEESERVELYNYTKALIESLLQHNDPGELSAFLEKVKYYSPGVKKIIFEELVHLARADATTSPEEQNFLDLVKNKIFGDVATKNGLKSFINVKKEKNISSLMAAVRRDDKAEVEDILSVAPELINQRQTLGEVRASPLQAACLREIGCKDMIVLLAKAGADLNLPDDSGLAPIQSAVIRGNLEAISALKDLGAELEFKSGKEWYNTDLYTLASLGEVDQPEIIRFLFDIGVSTESSEGLITAAYAAHLGEIAEYLKTDIDVNLQNKKGITCLMFAVIKNDLAIVKQLIGAGADWTLIDEEGFDALEFAMASEEMAEIAAYLRSLPKIYNKSAKKTA